MARVAASDDDRLLALPALSTLVLGRVHHGSFEGVHARPARHSGLAREAGREDDVVDLHLSWLVSVPDDGGGPLLCLFIVLGAALDGSFSPVVQLHRIGVVFEPAGELVLRREDWPVWRVGDVWEVVRVHGVVQDKVVVTLCRKVHDEATR